MMMMTYVMMMNCIMNFFFVLQYCSYYITCNIFQIKTLLLLLLLYTKSNAPDSLKT